MCVLKKASWSSHVFIHKTAELGGFFLHMHIQKTGIFGINDDASFCFSVWDIERVNTWLEFSLIVHYEKCPLTDLDRVNTMYADGHINCHLHEKQWREPWATVLVDIAVQERTSFPAQIMTVTWPSLYSNKLYLPHQDLYRGLSHKW